MTTRAGGARRRDGRRFFPRRKVCSFCVDKIEAIDYKDAQRLRRYISDWAKIESRRKTGTCAPHQRMLSTAIKRARYVGLLPYTGSHSHMDLTLRDGPRADRFRRDRERRAERDAERERDRSAERAEAPQTAGEVNEAAPADEAVETAAEPVEAADAEEVPGDEAAPADEAVETAAEPVEAADAEEVPGDEAAATEDAPSDKAAT